MSAGCLIWVVRTFIQQTKILKQMCGITKSFSLKFEMLCFSTFTSMIAGNNLNYAQYLFLTISQQLSHSLGDEMNLK